MLLNCDLGELEDADHRVERALMPHIDMANIACGLHAGSPAAMRNTLVIARQHGVRVGAHPGYADRENFGRVSIPHTPAQLADLLHRQIDHLQALAEELDMALDYVKPHGALYNDMMADSGIFESVLAALAQRQDPRTLMVLATGHWQRHRQLAEGYGIQLLFETFADRRYDDRGYLSSRQQPGAVLDHGAMLAQVRQLLEDGTVTTVGGRRLAIRADTLCIHGDSPDAVATIGAIRAITGGGR